MAYSPLAETVTPALSLQDPRRLLGEVRDDDVRAGAPDARERFHHRRVFVEPAELPAAFTMAYSPLTEYAATGRPNSLLHLANDVEIRQRGLDHHDVRAFVHVEGDLAHRFLGVGGVHLIERRSPNCGVDSAASRKGP